MGDRYRLVSPIGELDRSRRTEIFEVEDWGIRASDRHTPKLLKVLKPTDNPLWIRLFEQEFRVLTALRHPGIPQVDAYSFFPFALSDGTTVRCLVMEKIQGINLEQWIAQNGPISPELALNWLQQLAKILEFAHGKGFFHRDVKPANIMRRPNGKLVLIDWETAREITETFVEKRERQNVTLVISEGYTAPEQRQGKAFPKSDLFALGRTLVHLLIGSSPIELEDPETGQLVGWRERCPHLSPPLADAIAGLIAPASENRIQNSQILWQRLAEIELDGDLDLCKAAENHPSHHSIASANLFLGKLPSLARGIRPSSPIQSPLVKVAGIAFVFLGILGVGQEFILPQIALKLNEWGYERYVSDRYEAAEFYYQWALKFQPDFDSARYSLGATCEKLGKMDCAYANYQTARQSASDRVAAAAMNNLGRLQILNQNYESAIKLLLSALKRADETAIASDLYKNLGWVYLLQGQYPEAQSHLEMAISLNPEKPHAYCLLARALSDTGDQIAAQSIGKICHLRYDPKDKQPEIETWIPFPSQGTRATNITEQQ